MPTRELELEIAKSINQGHFSDAGEWLGKSDIGGKGFKESFINRIAEELAPILSKGVIQLTAEEAVKGRKIEGSGGGRRISIADSPMIKLPSINPYLEFVVKSGAIEVKKFNYELRAESEVEFKDAMLIIERGRIRSASFGSLHAVITLYISKKNKESKIGQMDTHWKLGEQIPL